MPNHDEIYANQAEMYDRLIRTQPSLSEIVNEIRPYQNLDVVDMGAGTGRLSAFLAPTANSLICTDQSSSMLDFLNSKLVTHNNVSTIVADHRDLPIESSSIDLVVSGWSICYLAHSNQPDWKRNIAVVMSEIFRILRSSGTLIIFETLGTGTEFPDPPDFLKLYYNILEKEYGLAHRWIRADYHFNNLTEAEEIIGFFFGKEMSRKVSKHQWTIVPECAGIWWKHL